MSQPQTETPATPTPAAPAAEPAKEAAKEPAKTVGDKFAAVKEKAKAPAAKPAEAKPEEKPAPIAAKDPDVEAVERILRQDAQNKKEAKRLAEERAAIAAEREREKPELETARAVKAAREKGDVVGILKAHGFTDSDIWEGNTSILFRLAEAKTKAPEVDQAAQLETAIAAKLAEKEAAAKGETEKAAKEAAEKAEKEKAELAAVVESAQDRYSKSVATIAAANPEKYPTLVKLGIPVKTVTDYAWQVLINTKNETILTEEEALADMEKFYLEKARAAVGVDDKPPEEKPAYRGGISVTPNWQAQTPGPGPKPAGSLTEKFQALKRKANQPRK